MKIKQSADDFQVDERTDIVSIGGDFALYRLSKIGATTHDAIAAVQRKWRVASEAVSFGGLKDKHAKTSQHMTIWRGPRRNLSIRSIHLEYLGQIERAYVSDDIRANRFRIIVRDLPNEAMAGIMAEMAAAATVGMPNYFDDQRFGSAPDVKAKFVAHHWIEGDYETGLRQALTADYEFDTAAQRRAKLFLQRHWRDWTRCAEQLPTGTAHSVVRFLLTHPSDFRGAVATMPAELSTLHLAAFQSAIWNCVLAEWLRGRFGANACNSFVSLKLGSVPILRSIADKDCLELLSQSLPLPCARLHYEDSVPNAPADWQLIVRKVLTDWGIGLADLRLPGLRRPFFSHGERAVWFRPADLRSTQHPDERHSGRRKLILSFELPRGCYATLVVKRITQLHTVTAAG